MNVLLIFSIALILGVLGQISLKIGVNEIGKIEMMDMLPPRIFYIIFQKYVFLGIYPGTVKIRFKLGKAFGNWFYYTLIDPKTLNSICRKARWKIIRVFEDKSSNMYSVIAVKR